MQKLIYALWLFKQLLAANVNNLDIDSRRYLSFF